ncbi:MAG: hypothetical protein AB1601_13540 [Planctomycetota bacterium]
MRAHGIATTAVVVTLSWAVTATAQDAGQAKSPAAVPPKLNADTALTIYPIILPGGARQDVADVVGAMLENAGMRMHDTTTAVFQPGAHDTLDELAAAFGQFLRQNPPPTDYALCAEFVGTPRTGAKEIRTVLLDRAGTPVWKDAQTPQDADFRRIQPGAPMTCCLLVAERLKPVFHLTGDPGTPVADGRFARRWREKSGTPSEAEFEAMKARLGALKHAGAEARVLIYPPRVGETVDRACAARLAESLNKAGLCKATVADTEPRFEVKSSSNEQRVLWDFARAAQEYAKSHPPEAEYVLFADYLVAGAGRVGAVHFVVCARDGAWVVVDFQNGHHEDFRRIAPKSPADCDRLVAVRLEHLLE